MDPLLVLLIVALAIVVLAVWFVFRRPREGMDTPRDEFAMRGKTSVWWAHDMLGKDAAHDLLDDAADPEGHQESEHNIDGVPDDWED